MFKGLIHTNAPKWQQNFGTCLGDLHESLVGIHIFPSTCLKIVTTNCEVHNSLNCPQCSFLKALYYQFKGEVQPRPVSYIQRPPINPVCKINTCQSL